jgi:hypothetical protein
MRRILLCLVLPAGFVFAVSACKTDVTGHIEKLAERACECADADCARAVLGDLVKLAKDNPDAKGDPDKVTKAAQTMGKCVAEKGVPLSELSSAMGELSK